MAPNEGTSVRPSRKVGAYSIVKGIAIGIAVLLALRVVHSPARCPPELETQQLKKGIPGYRALPPPFGHKVPREGIPATLVTSRTEPSFHIFAFHPSVDKIITNHLLHNGQYEPESTAFIQKLFPLGNNYIALDLGANVGFHGLHMASRGASVISFEASPDTAWLLRSSAALNGFLVDRPSTRMQGGSLTLIEKGVSDENSVGRMFRYPKSPGMTSFSKSNSFDLQKAEDGSALDVDIPLVRAGDVLKELGVSPNDNNLRLLKIDVEGFELRALKGLDLQKYHFEYLTLEFFPHLLKNAGTDPADLLMYIWSCGYRYFDFDSIATKTIDWEWYTDTGENEKDVRAWAEGMAQRGHEERGDGFHTNLFAKLKQK